MIELKNLTVNYDPEEPARAALRQVDLTIAAGESCAVVGPSGCGKSTLLKVLAGIITSYEGTATIDRRPISPAKQKIGFIPQNYGLLPWKNVRQNICLGVRMKKQEGAGLSAMTRQLGLSGLEERYPRELSGGQRQRVSLARAFLLRPDVLLMDEPFSALDAITREEMQDVLLDMWQTQALTTVLVTHYVEEAIYLGQKIVILSPGPGSVVKVIDNPLFGDKDMRSQKDFFTLSQALRNMIKKGRAS